VPERPGATGGLPVCCVAPGTAPVSHGPLTGTWPGTSARRQGPKGCDGKERSKRVDRTNVIEMGRVETVAIEWRD
jgi:hypothetical protein